MSATSQGGVVGFGPQYSKDTAVLDANWFYHRVLDTDMGIGEDQRAFPPEVGGHPMPGGGYKGGVMVGGGMTMHPRLENSIGWLLYAMLGKLASSHPALVQGAVLAPTALTGSAQTITTNISNPPSAAKICVKVHKSDSIQFTGTVTITQSGGTSITEVFDFSNGAGTGQRNDGLDTNMGQSLTVKGYECIVSAQAFTTVDSIVVSAGADTSIKISVGYEDLAAYTHDFIVDPDAASKTGWLGVRKATPPGDDYFGMGETYSNCKLINNVLTLPNSGPIGYRGDFLGTSYEHSASDSTPSWMVTPAFENYLSVPISSVLGGYITIPQYDNNPMKVVQSTFTWINAPLDQNVERVYGNPFLDDVTVTSRALAIDMVVKWVNPDLYRSIHNNSRIATSWSSKPFTSRVDMATIAPGLIDGAGVPFGLRVQAQQAMLGLRGPLTLSGNNAILLRLTGTSIDLYNNSNYAMYSLTNLTPEYTWPTS